MRKGSSAAAKASRNISQHIAPRHRGEHFSRQACDGAGYRPRGAQNRRQKNLPPPSRNRTNRTASVAHWSLRYPVLHGTSG